ncbi:hypothetical protein B566_EDAN013754 [Ephemera danica]|nr:hypothetical protein B566_EDAN013754 [Ephemera danica]
MDELPAAFRDNSYDEGLGLLLVFSHENFLRENLSQRDGTVVDAKRLERAFAAFNFEVQIYHDQTREQIADVLSSVRFEKYKSLVVIVMSHGQKGGLIAAKDGYYNVRDLYETLFYKPELHGKPKAIVLQACRGSNLEKRGLRGNLGLVSDVQLSNIHQDIKESDCLFAYSTVEGQQSFRDVDGSWYIQALCDVMERGPEHQCMTSILTCVQRQVLQKIGKDYTAQTPTFVSYLKRNFILHRLVVT